MLNKELMERILEKLLSQAKKSYDEFNAADGKIGDGDLGVTILNGLEEINNNKSNFKDDMENIKFFRTKNKKPYLIHDLYDHSEIAFIRKKQ